MHRIHMNQDIRPLSEFRANVATFIDQVHKTNRPLVITNHGKTTAVLLNVDEYESMVDRLELMQEIAQSRKEFAEGKGVPHETAKRRVLKQLRK